MHSTIGECIGFGVLGLRVEKITYGAAIVFLYTND